MYRYMPWSKRPDDVPQIQDDFVVLDIPTPPVSRSPSPPPPLPEIIPDVETPPDPIQDDPPHKPLDYWETICTIGIIYYVIVVNTVKKYWNYLYTFVSKQIGG